MGGRGGPSAQAGDVVPIHDVRVVSTRPTDIAATGSLHGGDISRVCSVVGAGVAGHIGAINFVGDGDQSSVGGHRNVCLGKGDLNGNRYEKDVKE